MAFVTVQVLEGLERGRIYRDVPTPVTIGREDENAIQLNDERVSRFHAKMQEDDGHIILTDLESTNGTRVNGHPVQLRVLRPGDQVGIGRCILLFGSDDEIKAQLLDRATAGADHTIQSSAVAGPVEEDFRELFGAPPPLPETIAGIQRARLADVLNYSHEQIRKVLAHVQETEEGQMTADWQTWQQLLQLEKQLAVYLKDVVDPEHA
jgi:pSer/pThr/pTyr-binding forkhead associated (FHA) protein